MQPKERIHLSLLLIVLLGAALSLFGVLAGCHQDNDESSPTTPNTPQTSNCGELFCYTASSAAGISIMADFTRHHLAGQPFGNWFVKAVWQSADRQFSQEVTVPVAIDEAGKGTAQIPVDYLNAILAQVNANQALWDSQPGLTLAFYPDDETWDYYQFD